MAIFFFFAMSPFRDIAFHSFNFSQSAYAICSNCYNQHDDSVTPQCPGRRHCGEEKTIFYLASERPAGLSG